MTDTLQLTEALIARPSVSPADGGCQELLIAPLAAQGFSVERLRFGGVDNFWARRGQAAPLLRQTNRKSRRLLGGYETRITVSGRWCMRLCRATCFAGNRQENRGQSIMHRAILDVLS